jgi:hypothetical protein
VLNHQTYTNLKVNPHNKSVLIRSQLQDWRFGDVNRTISNCITDSNIQVTWGYARAKDKRGATSSKFKSVISISISVIKSNRFCCRMRMTSFCWTLEYVPYNLGSSPIYSIFLFLSSTSHRASTKSSHLSTFPKNNKTP